MSVLWRLTGLGGSASRMASSHGPPQRATWVSSQYGGWLPRMFIISHDYTCWRKVEMCSLIYKKSPRRRCVIDIMVQLSHQPSRILLSFCPSSLLPELKVAFFFQTCLLESQPSSTKQQDVELRQERQTWVHTNYLSHSPSFQRIYPITSVSTSLAWMAAWSYNGGWEI